MGESNDGGADNLLPTTCWALKRGKPHMNLPGDGALRCRHVTAHQTTLEIPMAARGELYGMLEIGAQGDDAASRLDTITPVAGAIADAMSLALSGQALRERLRNQALRDPLTGLYNRRFLEEMLERLCLDAERRKTPVAAIMIDLDHFKRLNDQHGHAAGDAVLRDVAAAILSCLRTTDIACRYGGEELAIFFARLLNGSRCRQGGPNSYAHHRNDRRVRARGHGLARRGGRSGKRGRVNRPPGQCGRCTLSGETGRPRPGLCGTPPNAGSARPVAGERTDAKSPGHQRLVAEPADTA